jgi:HlyD family secretion protein
MRRTVVIVLASLVLIGSGYLALQRFAWQQARKTAIVRRGTLAATVQALGKVQARREVELDFPVGGRVLRVAAEVGEKVTPGQLLVELDPTPFQKALKDAQLTLEIRETQLAEARAGPKPEEVEVAAANLRKAAAARQAAQAKYDKVADKPNAETSPEALTLTQARADYEIAETNYQRVTSGPSPEELSVLEKQVEAARLKVEEAQGALAQAQLLAPFTGTVTAVSVHPDEIIPAYRQAVALADFSTLQIVAEVDEIDVGAVAAGQTVEIRLDAFPGRHLQGMVESVAPAAAPQRGSIVYETVVSLDPKGLPIRLGMGASLLITTGEKADVLLVPIQALHPAGSKQVVKVLRGGQVIEVPVVTGLSNESEAEVVEGLQEGDIVVIE